MSGLDLRRRTHRMHPRRGYAGLPFDPPTGRLFLRWGIGRSGDNERHKRAVEPSLVDTMAVSKDAFIQGLAFVLALGALTAFIAWTVLALANLWKVVTS